MTNQEAINALKKASSKWHICDAKTIAVNMAIAALEKDIPIKPINELLEGYGHIEYCPNCNHSIYHKSFKYCHICGQRIDRTD